MRRMSKLDQVVDSVSSKLAVCRLKSDIAGKRMVLEEALKRNALDAARKSFAELRVLEQQLAAIG